MFGAWWIVLIWLTLFTFCLFYTEPGWQHHQRGHWGHHCWIYVVKEHASSDEVEDIGIVLEGIKVLKDLDNIALAVAMLFGLMYVLNLSYPADLRYTFEVIQKIWMELDATKLSNKALALKNRLSEWTGQNWWLHYFFILEVHFSVTLLFFQIYVIYLMVFTRLWTWGIVNDFMARWPALFHPPT